MFKVKDNFLNKEEFNKLYNYIFNVDNQFPWFWYDAKEPIKNHKSDLTQYQLCHMFYNLGISQSSFYYVINDLLKKLKFKYLIRAKINLNPYSEKLSEGYFHIDVPNCVTAIFYLNTNNGYTLFENNKKVNSKKNRLVVFDSNLKHKGTNTTNKKFRSVINLNYVV